MKLDGKQARSEEHLPAPQVELPETHVLVAEGSDVVISEARWSADRPPPPVPGSTLAEIERHAIMTTYEACGRSPLRTAQVLGLSPRTIHYRLREYSGKPGRRLHVQCPSREPPSQTVR